MHTLESAASPRRAGAPSTPTLPVEFGRLRRILVVRADNIGDVVMVGPALRALRRAAPSAHIALLASPAGAQGAELLPWVDEVLSERVSWQALPPGEGVGPEPEQRLVERLAAGRFDAAFIFTSFSQTAWPAAHACLLAGIPIRVGQAADFGGAVLTHAVRPAPDGTHQVDRNLHLLAGVGVDVSPADSRLQVAIPPAALAEAVERLASVDVGPGQSYVVLAPGASAAARRYPTERFAEVARAIQERLDWAVPVLVGSAREASLLACVAAVPGVRSLVGRTGVAGLAGVIARAEVLVTSHSAPMHIADALRVPTVALFSGTDRRSEWGPRLAPSIVLGHLPECAPCRAFACPYALECLDIAPAEVVEAATRLAQPDLTTGEPTTEERWTACAS